MTLETKKAKNIINLHELNSVEFQKMSSYQILAHILEYHKDTILYQ